MILLLLACAGDPAPPAPAVLVPLDDARLARRISLDLRGVLPTELELVSLANGSESVDSLRDAWLEDPRLEDRLVAAFAEQWQTRVDVFDIEYYDYQLDPSQEFAFEQAVGEEPLRLMARIAVEDRPWYEIVTTDGTMANDLLGSLWPLDYPTGATGWQEVHYTDGRPPVGVLATNGLWWRYITNTSNMNRRRAAIIARLLLCEDLLGRPVSFSARTSQVTDVVEAVHSDPACLSCHSTVDPIAATLFGFWWLSEYSVVEETVYHPERENLGAETLRVQPAWFGQPLGGLSELGVAVANDPRFYRCAAESAASMLWRREVGLTDWSTIEDLRVAFLEEDLQYRRLLARVTDTPEYRVGGFGPAATQADQERELTRRLLPPAMLQSALADLTGFDWTWEGFDQLDSDELGFRVLAGGVDGVNLTRPQREPGLTWSLVVARASQGAADLVVERELVEDGGERLLLAHAGREDRPGDPDFTAELDHLHRRLYATDADADWREAAGALWTAVDAEAGPAEAWRRMLSAFLRDPDFVSD